MHTQGRNDEYLNNLKDFLAAQSSTILHSSDHGGSKLSDDTITLASMVQYYQTSTQLYFLYGAGSNQHNQLLLYSDNNMTNNGGETDGGDAHELSEILLCVPRPEQEQSEQKQQQQEPEDVEGRHEDWPKQLFAGGGNSALLTRQGRLYLFGWNHCGQSGPQQQQQQQSIATTPTMATAPTRTAPIRPLQQLGTLKDLRVETCALGFQHSLIIEQDTGQLYAMGDNSRGQVSGNTGREDGGAGVSTTPNRNAIVDCPTMVPFLLPTERVVDVACGLYHSAAITQTGEVVLFGCNRFGQAPSSLSLLSSNDNNNNNSGRGGRWKPDHAQLQKVACGRRHTVVLDDQGAVYSLGDNKYGQLGHCKKTNKDGNGNNNDGNNPTPQLVHGPWETDGYTVVDVQCGWSHTVVLARKNEEELTPSSLDGVDGTTSSSSSNGRRTTRTRTAVYGWGRNDKGQLGLGDCADDEFCDQPVRLFANVPGGDAIQQVVCGSEFTMVINHQDDIWACGWNEHGNLACCPIPHHPSNNDGNGGKTKSDTNNNESIRTPIQVMARDGTPMSSAVTFPPGILPQQAGTGTTTTALSLAAGGAHFITMRVVV